MADKCAGDQALALLGAARAALIADPGVAALCAGRVYDDVPDHVVWPYVTLVDGGAVAAFASVYESDDIAFDVHVWSRHVNRTSTECHRLCKAVQAALHDADLDLGAGVALARLVRTSRRIFRDPDNITWHGVASFEARVETIEE